jgi:hypothetical protein
MVHVAAREINSDSGGFRLETLSFKIQLAGRQTACELELAPIHIAFPAHLRLDWSRLV